MDYNEFLDKKQHTQVDTGIQPIYTIDNMFDFQKHIAEYAIRKGRCAIFLDTGLGKTIIELVIARNYNIATNRPVLIITPLAVAAQFLSEAEKFGIDDIEYSKDGHYTKKIVICNYERLSKFNTNDFDCVVLDESSILKNFDGAIKQQVTTFLKKVKYRYLATATPSPNDYIELGTSSEALGYMGYMDMLGRFFKNNSNNIAKSRQIRAGEKYYLKQHAIKDFWSWVSSWSISAKYPSDLGYNDDRFILPSLYENTHIVRNEVPLDYKGQTALFNRPAVNFFDIKQEVKSTLQGRCEMAVKLASLNNTSVYWTNLNVESSLLKQLDSEAVEILGQMNIEQKEEILSSFAKGEIKKLITKPTITAFGLNWQHCNHTVFFPTFSYEQYYQAIRRFWRFGQTENVVVDLVISDGQQRILDSLLAKKEQAIKMFQGISENTNVKFKISTKEFNKNIQLPTFI